MFSFSSFGIFLLPRTLCVVLGHFQIKMASGVLTFHALWMILYESISVHIEWFFVRVSMYTMNDSVAYGGSHKAHRVVAAKIKTSYVYLNKNMLNNSLLFF